MKKSQIIVVVLAGLLFSCNSSKKEEKQAAQEEPAMEKTETAMVPNALTDEEKAEGWKLLFDGEGPSGWRSYGKETFPDGWVIADGMIHCPGSGRGEAGGKDRGDIIYGGSMFSNFHLKLEWKISEGGNSGIFYLGQESDDLDYIWKTAPEMQVLDNDKHPDAKMGADGNRQAGSLYDLIPAKPQNAKPVGEWNQVEIMVYKGSVWHKMNGEKVVEYHLWTPEWNEMVAGSKFPGLNENWADVATEGYIGLQDHGDDVWFRNIKIKEL
ncbi:DUF1080 domain-containing protein [Muricauda sp. SCSIO 64092]|uniref:DUF1080 domain-containing protein n=1 Tax=Allomuricauda sp. SCSIO 64092 TaxID=2908842 RepID=UPI001FF27DBA|nr:DUF1080 domain-containing protein [Muricauda sp. SCSIO 64092]UOY08385.1 DUF1080 domain-containing protein [Muricauda sp. SCSIO 64092]